VQRCYAPLAVWHAACGGTAPLTRVRRRGGGGVAQADFQALGEAHECLKDPFQRSMYDSWLKGDQSEPFNPSGFPDLSELWPEGSWTQPLVLVRHSLVLAEGGRPRARAQGVARQSGGGDHYPAVGHQLLEGARGERGLGGGVGG
jgi:curved DNA-binding protein CbpA